MSRGAPDPAAPPAPDGDHRPAVDPRAIAAAVRAACLRAALEAYEDAGLQGLCAEGRWECAVAAMRAVEVEAVVEAARRGGVPGSD